MIIKDVNIEVADHGIATIAVITDISVDKTKVNYDLYKGVIDSIYKDAEDEKLIGQMPNTLLAKNRYSLEPFPFEITQDDYEHFYPPIHEPTEEDLEAQRLAEIAELEAKLKELKGE